MNELNGEFLKCSNCGIDLLEILVLEGEGSETSVRSNCPKCGDKSYVKILNTKFLVCPVGFQIVDEAEGFYTLA